MCHRHRSVGSLITVLSKVLVLARHNYIKHFQQMKQQGQPVCYSFLLPVHRDAVGKVATACSVGSSVLVSNFPYSVVQILQQLWSLRVIFMFLQH